MTGSATQSPKNQQRQSIPGGYYEIQNAYDCNCCRAGSVRRDAGGGCEINVTVVNAATAVFLWVKHLTGNLHSCCQQGLEGTNTANWTGIWHALAAVGGELEPSRMAAEIGSADGIRTDLAPLERSTSRRSVRLAQIVIDCRQAARNPGMISRGESITPNISAAALPSTTTAMITSGILDGSLQGPGSALRAQRELGWAGAVSVAGSLTTYYNDIQTALRRHHRVPDRCCSSCRKLQHILVTDGAQYAGTLVANKDWYGDQ